MLGYNVNSGVVDVVLGVVLTGIMTWVAYMMRQATRQGEAMAKFSQNVLDIEHRLVRLEDWRDGYKTAVQLGTTPPQPPQD